MLTTNNTIRPVRMKLCQNKVVIVTGGAKGIGRAISEVLAHEGASVMIVDVLEPEGLETKELIRQSGGIADYVHCDVTKANEVTAAVAATVSTYGRLDCLVNNAGIGVTGPLSDMTEADFDRITAINLKGPFLFLQSAISQMMKQGGGGSIVNVASVGGLVGTPQYALYAMTKHGVIGLTKCAALEYARDNIRVNSVCPGPTLTPMLEEVARQQGLSDVDDLATQQRVPMGRLGRAAEVAEAVAWLCSDRASNTTGSNLLVDGGYTAQ